MKKYYLAIDIGASSGRHIVGYKSGDDFVMEEVYRFRNAMTKKDGDLVWDTESIFENILRGIKACVQKFGAIESLAIDTWGVDYALMNGDKLISPVYAYRSGRTQAAVKKVHGIIPQNLLYEVTGEQFQPFNTVYQLYADKMSGRLDEATDFLMIPEYFNYRLTGKKVKEYTNATTGALVNALTNKFDPDLIHKLGLPERLFPRLRYAGEEVGDMLPEIAEQVAANVKVKLCASHDTACAFEAVDAKDNSVIISSGTWSLVGVKIKTANTSRSSFERNFANEGGVGYFRYLKNVMGMWIVNCLAKERSIAVTKAVEIARLSTYSRTFDVNDQSLVAPENMGVAIEKLLGEKLSEKDLFACVYRSLANGYAKAIEEIEENLGITVSEVIIVGGGAKNELLNELTEQYCKKKVVPMPIEATALGNLRTQSR